jgi:lysophospholipid acyltransferase (LPLAT)-like uncharacterized protein
MKIRRMWVIQSLCLLGCWLLQLLLATVFCKYWRFGRDYRPAVLKPHQRYIYALWHEYLLVPIVHFSHSSARLLVSQHADGLIVAEICKHLRMGVVRGSSTRGGVEAIRRILRPGRYRCLAVTPDGPRGPRRQVQLGVIYLAARLGWPIVAVGIGYRRPWRLRSWDRLAIPRPFHPAAVISTEPLTVPPDLGRHEMELYRQKLQAMLDALTEKAESAAATGKKPAAPVATPTVADAA